MVGHLREEKSPETLFAAARLLAQQPGIHIDHIGEALDPALGAAARETMAAAPNYRWLGGMLTNFQTMRKNVERLRKIETMTTVIAAGDFDQHIDLDSPPELAELARSFDQMSDRLKQLDEMKSDFFQMVSHELRTPIHSIKEGISIVLEGLTGELNEEQKEVLNISKRCVERLVRLINDVLAFHILVTNSTWHRRCC